MMFCNFNMGILMKTVVNTIAVLTALQDAGHSLPLRKIAEICGLDRAATLRILKTLRSEEFVEQDINTKHYGLGYKLIGLGAIAQNIDGIYAAARSSLLELWRETDRSITIWKYDNKKILLIDVYEGKGGMGAVVRPGFKAPLHAIAAGKVFLAEVPGVLDLVLEKELIRYTDKTICTLADLRKEVGEVRQNEFAVCEGEHFKRGSSMATAVRDANGNCVAAVSLAQLKPAFSVEEREHFSNMIFDTAQRISYAMGHRQTDVSWIA
jgi:DNA-binding IclR family transcriptional regulator